MLRFDTIQQYNEFNRNDTLHPLASVVDLSKAAPREGSRMYFGFYCIFLKDVKCGDLIYGKNTYDYQEGTLVFLAPDQVAGISSNGETYQPKGWALVFHPELIYGTHLGQQIHNYSYFGYQSNEALHISQAEKQLVFDCFSKIENELRQEKDIHSKKLITSNIELFLDYCLRFYDRQFQTRNIAHKGIMARFDRVLHEYFHSEKPYHQGVMSVAMAASELNLSAGYFGDLIKKETGCTAQELIQSKLMDIAKGKLADMKKNVGEVAEELGFTYPQHFTRLFKQKVGYTPNEYRLKHKLHASGRSE